MSQENGGAAGRGREGIGREAELERAAAAGAASLRELPSVNALLQRPRMVRIAELHGRALARQAAQGALEDLRELLQAGEPPRARAELLELAEDLAAGRAREARRSSLRRVVNATGVVVHTNLGRAPLAPAAARAAARAARGYVTLEYDLGTGGRGSRHVHGEALLRELTGAGGALVVNNAAAALLLAVNTVAAGRAVLVSRGELIEIGGGFRIHEILTRSGARLVEVGSTNKTHAADYLGPLRELGDEVGAVLKVHRSNFVQTGFVAEVEAAELARLLREETGSTGATDPVPLVYDLGSGCMVDLTAYGLPPEPRVQDAVQTGAALVAFSGDKLLGGPQAGILLGEREWIRRARTNPLTRALRVDKLTLGALEATLRVYRDPERLARLPLLAMLARPAEELRTAAEDLRTGLAAVKGLEVEVVATEARVGGGTLPGAKLAGWGVALSLRGGSVDELEHRLRSGATAVIGRAVGDRLVLDLRSVPAAELSLLQRLVIRALSED